MNSHEKHGRGRKRCRGGVGVKKLSGVRKSDISASLRFNHPFNKKPLLIFIAEETLKFSVLFKYTMNKFVS